MLKLEVFPFIAMESSGNATGAAVRKAAFSILLPSKMIQVLQVYYFLSYEQYRLMLSTTDQSSDCSMYAIYVVKQLLAMHALHMFRILDTQVCSILDTYSMSMYPNINCDWSNL